MATKCCLGCVSGEAQNSQNKKYGTNVGYKNIISLHLSFNNKEQIDILNRLYNYTALLSQRLHFIMSGPC